LKMIPEFFDALLGNIVGKQVREEISVRSIRAE
jgi:hypothetical protein